MFKYAKFIVCGEILFWYYYTIFGKKIKCGEVKKMPKKKDTNKKGPLISLLINSAYYFIESVYILHDNNQFRLIVLHKGMVLKDTSYKTARDARIAFQKQFKSKSWKKGVKAQWTVFYNPDQKWIEGKAA
jgi:hypothetical protein